MRRRSVVSLLGKLFRPDYSRRNEFILSVGPVVKKRKWNQRARIRRSACTVGTYATGWTRERERLISERRR